MKFVEKIFRRRIDLGNRSSEVFDQPSVKNRAREKFIESENAQDSLLLSKPV
jgi:hypothetical protein